MPDLTAPPTFDPKYTIRNKPTAEITTEEMLAAWDAGGAVWSVEMGGIGPGYEQCIQVLAVELVRALLPMRDVMKGVDWGGDKKGAERCYKQVDKEIAEPVVSRLDKTLGFSGAQVGAAKNLAWNIVRNGWGAAVSDPVVKDRLIKVSKEFPRG